MKDPNQKPSRVNKNKDKSKESNLTKNITIGLVIVLILSLAFLAYTIFGGNDKNNNDDMFLGNSDEVNSSISESSNIKDNSSGSEKAESSTENSSSSDSSSEATSSENESSSKEDEEVIKKDWEPQGTEQSGKHKTNFSNGSQDRKEIKSAVSNATGLNEGDMIEWWVGNAGNKQVEATVSNKSQSKTYRVSLKWVDGKGWQPTQVENVKSNPYN